MTKRRIEALRMMAAHGTEHERRIAQGLLDRADVPTDSESWVYAEFPCANEYENRLFWQVATMILDDNTIDRFSVKEKPHVQVCRCTELEREEISLFFDSYRAALSKELETTLEAFINKNDIFTTRARANPSVAKTEEAIRIMKRAREMDAVEVRRRIGGPSR